MNNLYKGMIQQIGKESDKIYIKLEKNLREPKLIEEEDVFRFYLNIINMIVTQKERKELIEVLKYLKEINAENVTYLIRKQNDKRTSCRRIFNK